VRERERNEETRTYPYTHRQRSERNEKSDFYVQRKAAMVENFSARTWTDSLKQIWPCKHRQIWFFVYDDWCLCGGNRTLGHHLDSTIPSATWSQSR